MGDLECGFEEMQGVRLGYLLIKGKQMFALSQVFTDLLKNIPRTTVHKRMDHLKVKKHHCDLEELRKLKAINSIAFHAAKCTLISREDVEALYISCKTERVLKSNKKKAKAACSPEDKDASPDLLHADAELWNQKVWFSLHGVPEKLVRHNKPGRRKELSDSKLPQFYHKPTGREHRLSARSGHKHFKNYENEKIAGNRVTLSQRHGIFRSSVSRQPVLFQSAMAAQSRHSRLAGDLFHKRKRRREGGGGRDSARQHSWSRGKHAQHVSPVLFLHPKSPGSSFGAFHISPDFYFDSRSQHYHHGLHEGFPESYSSDTESSTYSSRDYQDSDFGSGLSSTSCSEEEDEGDEDELESSEVSTEEEDSSSQSDSSSVSSQVSVQSIRFRRARVGSLAKSLNKAPLVLQPTFHYNNKDKQQNFDHVAPSQNDLTSIQAKKDFGPLQPPKFNLPVQGYSFFTDSKQDKTSDSSRTVDCLLRPCQSNAFLGFSKAQEFTPGLSSQSVQDKSPKCSDQKEGLKTSCIKECSSPPKKIKTEAEELLVTAAPHTDSGNRSRTPPFNINNVKVKEESCDDYDYQGTGVICKSDKKESIRQEVSTSLTEVSPDVAPKSPCGPQECKSTRDTPEKGGRLRTRKFKTLELKKRPMRSKTKQGSPTRTPCSSVSSSSSSSSSRSEDTQTLELPSRRKRSTTGTVVATPTKMLFRLLANFPSTPSLVVGNDGDLCPAYSMNSLRGLPGPPPQSHPVWKWQPGGHILPPPHAHRTRK